MRPSTLVEGRDRTYSLDEDFEDDEEEERRVRSPCGRAICLFCVCGLLNITCAYMWQCKCNC